jgi:hypothetical protein
MDIANHAMTSKGGRDDAVTALTRARLARRERFTVRSEQQLKHI